MQQEREALAAYSVWVNWYQVLTCIRDPDPCKRSWCSVGERSTMDSRAGQYGEEGAGHEVCSRFAYWYGMHNYF